MTLQIADWHDYLKVLHETVHIWSAGLSRLDYQRFLRFQQTSPWFKKNCRLYVLKDQAGQVQASCKLYSLKLASRGRTYRVAGLGAVYTQAASRNQGFASGLINDVLDLCEEREFDGVILFSEIAGEFYHDFGFEPLGSSTDFEIESSACFTGRRHSVVSNLNQIVIEPLSARHVPLLTRYYDRWLRRQPYGVERDADYWLYKVTKERFLSQHVARGRPGLEVGFLSSGDAQNGYFIGERKDHRLRLLEVIGDRPARRSLWQYLTGQLLEGALERLSGWEGLLRDMAPSFQIRGLDLHLSAPETNESASNAHWLAASKSLKVFFRRRTWGQGMIHVLNPHLEGWLQIDPCPLLELDHL